MVIDSSALIVLLLDEPETRDFVAAIARASTRLVGAPSYLETSIVMLGRSGPTALESVNRLLAELSAQIVPFSEEQALLAIGAYKQYGRGTGHPAHLNFGDCFTYALAKQTAEPLLFKGGDFSHTDLTFVIGP